MSPRCLRFTSGPSHNATPVDKVIKRFLSRSLFSRLFVCRFNENNSSVSIFDLIYVEYEQFFIVFKISWTLISKKTLQWLGTFISFKMHLSFNSMIICLIRLRMMALQKRCSESLCLRLVKIWTVKSVSTALTWLEAQNDHRL